MPGRASINEAIWVSSSPLRSVPPAMVVSSPMMLQIDQPVEMPYDPLLQQPEQQQQPNGVGGPGSYSTLAWLSLLAVTAGASFMAGKKSRQGMTTMMAQSRRSGLARGRVAMSFSTSKSDAIFEEAQDLMPGGRTSSGIPQTARPLKELYTAVSLTFGDDPVLP